MAVTYVRTFTTTCPGALIDAINDNIDISPVLIQITNEGGPGDSTFYFDVALSGPEVTEFDSVLGSWVCPPPPDAGSEDVEYDDAAGPDPDVIWSSDKIQSELDLVVIVEEDGSAVSSSAIKTLNFTGGGVTASQGSPATRATINISGGGGPGSASKRMNTWTLLSGNLYFNDFLHNLGTDEVTIFMRDFATDQELRAEYVEIIDINTVRVVVEGNMCDIVTNVVSGGGQGPIGPPGSGTTITVEDDNAPVPNTPHSILNFGANLTATDDGSGQVTIDAADSIGDVVDDTTPQLGGFLDMNQNNIRFTIPSSDLTGVGFTVSATVDVNSVGFGAALFMAADGNFETTDADAAATMPCRALALEAGTGTRLILLQGFIRNNAWNWTPGLDMYVSTTTGLLTQTLPNGSGDQVQKVGFAWNADVVYFNPGDYTIVEVA